MRNMPSISKKRKIYEGLKFEGQQTGSREFLYDLVADIYKSIPKRFEDEYGETIHKELQKDDEHRIIRLVSNMIYAGENVEPYAQIKSYIRQQYRSGWSGTKRDIWNAFKTDSETRPVYNKFNSYMYRNGYSASKYWFQNVKLERDRKIIICTCELPDKSQLKSFKSSYKLRNIREKVVYDELIIQYNYSDNTITANFTL